VKPEFFFCDAPVVEKWISLFTPVEYNRAFGLFAAKGVILTLFEGGKK